LIEFALVLPLLLAIALAALDLGRAFFAKNVLRQAAREGVRMRVRMTASEFLDGGDVLVYERVRQVARGSGFPSASVSTSIGGPDAAKYDSVRVTAPFRFTFPLLFKVVGMNLTNPMPLTATCYMRQE